MSHVDDGQLHALVDDALDAQDRAVVDAHLATCGDCARRFAEATALARQTLSLLAMLDEAPARATIAAPPAAAPVRARTPAPARTARPWVTLRRVAVAASFLVVAGVSYRMGDRDEPLASPAATEAAPVAKTRLRALAPEPSVVASSASESLLTARVPSVRVSPRGGPRAESSEDAAVHAAPVASPAEPPAMQRAPLAAPAVSAARSATPAASSSQSVVSTGDNAGPPVAARAAAEQRAEPRVDQRGRTARDEESGGAGSQRSAAPAPPAQRAGESSQQAAVPLAAPAVSAASEAANLGAAAAKGTALPGYTAVENDVLPNVTRRRYVSSAGTPLLLVIVQPAADAKVRRAARTGTAEYVVTSANGRSVVRWSAQGRDYELQGSLAPDSLVKLAGLIK
jgi:hypothetical protein